nr:hypothetical protein [Tanacetum cinerariifolium]
GTEGVVGLSCWFEKMESVFHISGCGSENQVKFATCTLLDAALTWWNGHQRTLGHDEKVDKYIGELPDNIHGNVMSARPKTLDEAIELANDLMDQKLCTYAESQTESKRKFDNNNQAQQLTKRQNVAQAYVIRTGARKEYAGTLPLCNKCKFHHNGSCTTKARGMVYALGGEETNQDLDDIEDDINA